MYETILCGDLLGNGGPNFTNNSDNSYHVVTTSGTDATARLDGFIIERGNATASKCLDTEGGTGGNVANIGGGQPLAGGFSPYGGGVRNEGGALTIANCVFRTNWGYYAGAMFNTGTPIVQDCSFIENDGRHAGGIRNYNNHLTLIRCVFSGNDAEFAGSALYATGGYTVLQDCTLDDNATPFMGAVVYIEYGATAELGHCRLRSGPGSPMRGTAVFTERATVTLDNSLVWGFGVATVWFGQCVCTLLNCTFAGNSRTLSCEDMSPPGIVYFHDCILWNQQGEEFVNWNGSTITGSHSVVRGGWPGAGNIEVDPMFLDPGGEDYRLQAGSPCIDAADNDAVAVGVVADLGSNRRFIDDFATPDTGNGSPPIVDMGAYEYQVPVTPGDLSCDGNVDFGDINPFVMALTNPTGWQAAYTSCGIANGDINADGRVDFGDINPFVALLTAP